MTFNPILSFLRWGLKAVTQDSAPKEEACSPSLPSTAFFSCPRDRARHCFGLLSKNTTSRRCPSAQGFCSWAPDGGARASPDLKINPPLGILQHKLTSPYQTNRKYVWAGAGQLDVTLRIQLGEGTGTQGGYTQKLP